MASTFSPDTVIPFQAYRRLDLDRPLHDLAASLSHFYEAEKVRGMNEPLRQEILSCAAPRAARKLAKRHNSQWRPDWSKVRGRVFKAGLAMQMLQSSEARAHARDGFDRAIEIAAAKRVSGLPGSFVAQALQSLFGAMATRSTLRLGALTVQGYTPEDLEARLEALSAGANPPLSATLYGGPEACLRLERWCMSYGLPVKIVGADATRLRAAGHQDLTQRINLLIVCAPASRKAVSELIAPARKSKIRVLDFSLKERAANQPYSP